MSRFVLTAQLQLQAPTNVGQVVRQIQNQLNNVQVNVQVQGTQQAQRQLNNVATATNQAANAATRLGQSFGLSIKRFAAFSIATRAVSLFTSTLSKAVEESIAFERELLKISQVTGKTLGQLRDLTGEITKLSTGLGVSSTSLLSVSRILSQAGLNADETRIALDALAKSELAPTFDNITETAEGAVAIFNQFRLGAEALEAQLGSINAVAGRFAVEAGDLIGVVRRVGGVFKASGGDLNELIALFTSVRATTRESAESIATGLRTIFTRIQRPETIQFLKQFGVELLDLEGKFVGPFEATKRLSEALAGLEQGDITFIKIAEELGGFRQIGKVIPLLQQFAVAQEALNVAQQGSGSLASDAAKAQAALAIRITKVKEEFLALVRSITETTSFQLFANTALNLASALIKLADALKPIIPLLVTFAGIKLATGFGGFMRGVAGGLRTPRGFATGGLVPGSGNRDTVPAMLTPGEFVIRKSSVAKLGAGTLSDMNNNKFAKGSVGKGVKPIQKGKQVGGVGIFDSDKIPGGTNVKKALLEQLRASKKPYQVISGPAGSGKTTFAAGRFGANFVLTPADLQKYSRFVVLSGAGKTKSGDFSDDVKGLLSGASGITVLNPGADRLMQQRQGRVDAAMSGNLPDERSVGALQGTMRAPTDSNLDLFRGYGNVNVLDRYAAGGVVSSNRSLYGPKPDFRVIQQQYASLGLSERQAMQVANGTKTIAYYEKQKLAGRKKGEESKQGTVKQITLSGPFGASFLRGYGTNVNLESRIYDVFKNGNRTGVNALQKAIQASTKLPLEQSLPKGAGITVKATRGTSTFLDPKGSKIFDDEIMSIIPQAFDKAAKKFNGELSIQGPPKPLTSLLSKSAISSIEGQFFEAYVRGITNNVIQDEGKKDAIFDFSSINQEQANKLFGVKSFVLPNEFKNDPNPANISSILAKAAGRPEAGIRVQKFATGGAVGTDTVPALLTPGEFVINRSSAQKIGYGSLNRMNKVGKYAKGGVVQRFNTGGGVTSNSVKANIGGLADNGALQREIAATAQEIKKTGSYAKILSTSLDKQSKITNTLYQESSALDKRISGYDRALAQIASQQGKAAATGTAANRIVKMKMDAEQRRIDVDNKALAEEQKLEGIKKKHTQTIEKQTQLMDKQNALIAQAKSNKQAATQLTQESLQGGTYNGGQARIDQTVQKIGDRKQRKIQNASKGLGFGGGGGLVKDIGGAAIAVGMLTASLQAMLPPLDENSTAFTKLSHGILSTITMLTGLAFTMQAFGVSINAASIASFISGNVQIDVAASAGLAGVQLIKMAGSATGASATLQRLAGSALLGANALANTLVAAAGPMVAIVGGFFALNAALKYSMDAFYNYSGRLKKAQDSGNVNQAGRVAEEQANMNRNLILVSAGLVLAITAMTIAAYAAATGLTLASVTATVLGSPFVILAAVVMAAVAAFMYFASESSEAAKTNAEAIAQQANVTKALKKASEDATKAMKEFEQGNLSAAGALAATKSAGEEIQVLQQRNATADQAVRNQSGLQQYFNQSSQAESKAKRDEELKKAEEEFIKTNEPATNALGRAVAATGGSFEDFMKQIKASNKPLFDVLIKNGIGPLQKAFENIKKEAERTKKAFDAMNLGFQNVSAISGALSVSMDNYLASQEAGYSGLNNTIALLEASVTNAAQGISDADFSAALGNASDGLRKLGASEAQIKKFEENLTAINSAQKFYAKASEETKNQLMAEFQRGAGGPGGSGPTREKFAQVVADQLAGAGIGEEARNRIKDALSNAEISPEDLEAIAGGNMEVLDRVLQELGETTLNQVIGPLKELAKYEQQLASITKQKLELESRVVEAQKGVLAAQLEAQEIAAKYGGAAVTPEMKRQNILGQANIEAQAAGVSGLQTGSAAELNQRNREIRQGLGQIGEIRAKAAAGDKQAQAQLEGQSGVKLAEQEKRLQELAKSEYETTKQLIGLKEEELKLIQEKNRLEKSSIEALVTGDIDKFFQQQAAVGATAAISLGNQSLMGAFGPDALGAAALDIQKQQEAGVQSLYGQQLGGPGGLVERGFGAAISARGVSSPLGMAQVAAGTTAEEEAAKSEIRDLAATLPNYAETQLQVANQDLNTAQIQMQAAEMQLQAAKQNAKDRGVDVAGMARGGPVYANNGIFVPRGTDTVPAMLTPGEFVVRRSAVQRGNNLAILQAMNRGQSGVSNSGDAVAMANGGKVQYLRFGNRQPVRKIFGSNQETGSQNASFGISPELINQLTSSLNKFNTDLSANIDRLNNTTFNIKLDNTNINVNLTGTSFLSKLKDDLTKELYAEVGRQLSNSRVGDDGKLKQGTSVV